MSINVNTQLIQLKIHKPEEQLNNSKLVNLLNCLCHRRDLDGKNSKSSPNLVSFIFLSRKFFFQELFLIFKSLTIIG